MLFCHCLICLHFSFPNASSTAHGASARRDTTNPRFATIGGERVAGGQEKHKRVTSLRVNNGLAPRGRVVVGDGASLFSLFHTLARYVWESVQGSTSTKEILGNRIHHKHSVF